MGHREPNFLSVVVLHHVLPEHCILGCVFIMHKLVIITQAFILDASIVHGSICT